MFLKSYEKNRKIVLANTTISTFIQLEYNAFGPAVVPICTFTLRNSRNNAEEGEYIKAENEEVYVIILMRKGMLSERELVVEAIDLLRHQAE